MSAAPQLVLFDCDGVLVDSETLQAAVFSEQLQRLGLAWSPAECAQRFTGQALGHCFASVETVLGAPLPEHFAAELAEATQLAFRARLRAMPGAQVTLAALSVAGLPWAVASNGSLAKMAGSLEAVGLGALTAGRRFSAEGLPPKPDPALFLAVAQRFGVDPSNCWVVEDSAPGLAAARAAGMTALALGEGGGPGSLTELTQLLVRLQACTIKI